jgi:hypothetical protein
MSEIRTALEIVMSDKPPIDENYIPKITHELGRHWKQPDREKIVVDSKSALMDKATYEQLAEYSCSVPTGVYEGKMWRKEHAGKKYLRWYGKHADPGMCSINTREVIFV